MFPVSNQQKDTYGKTNKKLVYQRRLSLTVQSFEDGTVKLVVCTTLILKCPEPSARG